MRRAALAILLIGLGVSAANASFKNFRKNVTELARTTGAAASGPLFSLLASGSSDQSAVADLCDTYAASMTGNYWCLRGDGTGTGATLTATGSPTTETRSYCGNGSSCGNVSSKRFTTAGSDYYTTAAVASPAASFTVCARTSANTVGTLQYFVAKKNASAVVHLYVDTAARAAFDVFKSGGSTSIVSAASAVTARAAHFVCGRYTYVGDGTSSMKVFVDGAASGTPSTTAVGPPLVASNAWGVAVNPNAPGTQALGGTVGNAFYTESALDDATILAMSKTALGFLTPSTGQTLTYTRTTSSTCLNTDGDEVTVLPPNRPCITQGGIQREAAATNLVLQSSNLGTTWVASNATVAQTATHPDGTALASTVTATAANATVKQSLTVASSLRATSAFVRRRTGTGTVELTRDDGSTWIDITSTLSTTWSRFTPATHSGLSTTSANPIVGLRIVTSGDAVDVAYFQDEVGAFATSPIETTTASVTRTAGVLTVPNPLTPSNPASWCMGATGVPYVAWGTPVDAYLLGLGTLATANSSALYSQQSVTPRPYWRVEDNAAANRNIVPGTATIDSDRASHRFVATNASGTMTLYQDAVSVGTPAGAGTGVITTQPATAYLGARSNGGNQFNGLVSAMLIDSTLTGCQ